MGSRLVWCWSVRAAVTGTATPPGAARRALPRSAAARASGGEVVTGTEERLATGDALNVAARLQQAARPGEVLIAAATRVLAGEAVDVEPLEPLALKGKSEPLAAFRLFTARAASERRHE